MTKDDRSSARAKHAVVRKASVPSHVGGGARDELGISEYSVQRYCRLTKRIQRHESEMTRPKDCRKGRKHDDSSELTHMHTGARTEVQIFTMSQIALQERRMSPQIFIKIIQMETTLLQT